MNRAVLSFILMIAYFAFSNAPVLAGDSTSDSLLLLNVPVSREFKNGDRHFFRVSVREDEAVEIVCERKGVDIGLRIFAPNGEKIAVSNAPAGFSGSDRLFFIADKTGEYRLELDSRRPGDFGGSYSILLKTERHADGDDQKRAAAMKLLGEAREMMFGAENRPEKSAKAIEKLENALKIFEKTDDSPDCANTLFQLGLIYGYELGEKAKAIGFYEKALEIWSKIDDDEGRAICLAYLADEIRDFDTPETPRKFYTDRAREYFEQAAALNRKHGDQRGEAVTLSFFCRLYNDAGNFQKGFETCRAARQLETDSNPLTDYRIYTNLASLYGNSGDAENSLKYNRLALERLEIVKDYVSGFRAAFVKSNIGGILLNQQKFDEAEGYLSDALNLTEKIGRKDYSAYIRVRLATIYLQTNRLPQALETARKAVEFYREFDPVKIQAALNALGNTYFALGQFEDARHSFDEAIEINRRNKDRYAEAASLYNLAKLENSAGNLETARQTIALAVSHSEVLRAQFLGKSQRASYLSILKKYYELQIELLIKLDEKNPGAGFAEQAWQTHEKIRARLLMENLIESGLNINELALPDFFAAEQKILEAVTAAEIKRAEGVKSKDFNLQKKAESDLSRNLDEYRLLQENLRQKNPQFAAVNEPRNFTAADAQKLLDEDTAILEFALGENESCVWTIRKNSFELKKLPPKSSIEAKAREFYAALTDRNAKDEQAIIEKSRNLSREILSPVADSVKNARRIIIITDGALQTVPFAALTLAPDALSYEPLAATIETVHAPSFATMVYIHENKLNRQQNENKLLAVFADPIFQADDERFASKKPAKTPESKSKIIPETLAQTMRELGIEELARLPFSGIEARAIGKYAPEKTFLAIGAEASRQKFMRGDFNSYRYLHFATHGFLNQQNPELSGLVLSLYDENRRAQNGFLRVIDLYSMRLNADLVVLSACQTALGKDVDGEGIVGLTRGFMYAGAAGVISSLWKVEDAATAELMKRFYRALLKENKTPSAALRIAKNEMRQIPRFRSPRFWAGFTLNGEWQ